MASPIRYQSTHQDQVTGYALRVALDLQLDTFLLTLGGSIRGMEPQPGQPLLPWNRWLEEDLERTRTLAGTAAREGASLPATLQNSDSSDQVSLLENLITRYSTIIELIESAGPTTKSVLGGQRPLLTSCQQRLTELRNRRGALTERHRFNYYLPGELLG